MSQNTITRMTLNAREAAIALGISERTLWARTKAGDVPHVKIGGRVLYLPAQLESWLLEQATKNVADAKPTE